MCPQGRFNVLLCFNITSALCDVIEIFSLSLCLGCIGTPVIGLGVEIEFLYIEIAL